MSASENFAKPYGCSNSVKTPGYFVGGLYIVDRSSSKCRYDMRSTDLRCGQCGRESDVEYFESMGLRT